MKSTSTWRTLVFLALGFLASSRPTAAKQVSYNPLTVTGAPAACAPLELTVADAARNRELPILVYLPAGKTTAPVVLFSHGLGGSAGSAFLGKHWAARGYVCVFLQHPGSDTSVWKGKPPTEVLVRCERRPAGRIYSSA